MHGRNGSVREGLRVVPQLHAHGFTTMLINYRDDLQEPGAPYEDGIGNFGVTEWSDLEAAVHTAQAQGAQRILLVGYSMGGAIIAAYLEHAPQLGPVAGTILISPAISLPAIVDWGAEQKGLPVHLLRPVIWGAEQLAQLRSPIDVGAADYLDTANTWPVPALVTAGSEDDLVPPDVIEEFAADLPVGQFELFDRAAHTGEWNLDQSRFDALVAQWLDDLPQDSCGEPTPASDRAARRPRGRARPAPRPTPAAAPCSAGWGPSSSGCPAAASTTATAIAAPGRSPPWS